LLHGNTITSGQFTPFGIVSVDHGGNFSTYSPEVLAMGSRDYGDFLIGNVHHNSFAEAYASAKMRTLMADIRAGVEQCRLECPYFALCGGGVPANKYFENGSSAHPKRCIADSRRSCSSISWCRQLVTRSTRRQPVGSPAITQTCSLLSQRASVMSQRPSLRAYDTPEQSAASMSSCRFDRRRLQLRRLPFLILDSAIEGETPSF
jgi:radical SAM protein with 4Fe4S-binding SPASM domain